MKKRAKITPDSIADVLAACRRRCCVCFGLHKEVKVKKGQVAHLDHDPNNNEPENLAFICLAHHDEYDSKTSQSKGLTAKEVKRYRTELVAYLAEKMPPKDNEIVSQLGKAFDRPAFRTSFQQESSLPRFREALSQTIETLNTGKTPQGNQLPSKMQIRDVELRGRVDQLVQALVALRANYDKLLRQGDIRHCGCNVPDCPVHFLSALAIKEMDARRLRLLSLVHGLDPSVPQRFYETE